MKIKNSKQIGPDFVDQDHCNKMMATLGWNNQSLDEDARQAMQRMSDLYDEIKNIQGQIEDERMELERIRHKWGENFEEYMRWKAAKEKIYNGHQYKATA